MSEFSKRLADEIRQADEDRKRQRELSNTESAAFVEREELKRALGPELWRNFRDQIVSNCNEVNENLGREHYRIHDELPNKLHVIRLNPAANLRLEFSPEGSRIHYEAGHCVGDYLIGIDPGTAHAYLTDVYERSFDMESTSQHLLRECLEKAQF